MPETGSPPGAMRSKPINTARGTPGKRRTCGSLPDFDRPRCREASRSAGPSIFVCAHCVNLSAPGTLAFRAPSALISGRGGSETTAYPGPIKNTGDESRLLLVEAEQAPRRIPKQRPAIGGVRKKPLDQFDQRAVILPL